MSKSVIDTGLRNELLTFLQDSFHEENTIVHPGKIAAESLYWRLKPQRTRKIKEPLEVN